jgi:hypothetical protein
VQRVLHLRLPGAARPGGVPRGVDRVVDARADEAEGRVGAEAGDERPLWVRAATGVGVVQDVDLRVEPGSRDVARARDARGAVLLDDVEIDVDGDGAGGRQRVHGVCAGGLAVRADFLVNLPDRFVVDVSRHAAATVFGELLL